MKFSIFLAFTLLLASSMARADFVSPLETDRDSMQARFDVLNDPQLKEISFSTFTLKNDQIGSMFLAMLIDASKRGVRVRGIVDNDISGKSPELVALLDEAGVSLRYYHRKTIKPLKLLNPIKFFNNLDRRLHDKLFIATYSDGRRALLQGDKNYDDIYFGKTGLYKGPEKSFQGREIFVEGAAATEAAGYFDFLWSSKDVATRKSKAPVSAETLQTERLRLEAFEAWVKKYVHGVNWRKNRTRVEEIRFMNDDFDEKGRRVYSTLDQVLDLIEASPPHSQIEIENSYLVLNSKMERAFRTALAKGSRIRIITNSRQSNDVKLVSIALQIDLKKYREMGVDVYYTNQQNAVHSKMVAINDTLIIMSANFDPRSLKINSESGVILHDRKLTDHYRHLFNENIGASAAIIAQGAYVDPAAHRSRFSILRTDRPIGALLQSLFISLIRSKL